MASTPTPTFFGFAYFNGNEAVLENYLEADRFFLNSWHFSLGISATFCHFSDEERQRLYVVGIFLQMFIKFLGMFSTPLNCHNSIQCVLWNFLLFTLFFDRRQFDKFFEKNILTRVIFTEFSSCFKTEICLLYHWKCIDTKNSRQF